MGLYGGVEGDETVLQTEWYFASDRPSVYGPIFVRVPPPSDKLSI